MEADDKKKVQQAVSDIVVRYGAGAHYIQKIGRAKAWNLIAWLLIGLGVVGWCFFLTWKP